MVEILRRVGSSADRSSLPTPAPLPPPGGPCRLLCAPVHSREIAPRVLAPGRTGAQPAAVVGLQLLGPRGGGGEECEEGAGVVREFACFRNLGVWRQVWGCCGEWGVCTIGQLGGWVVQGLAAGGACLWERGAVVRVVTVTFCVAFAGRMPDVLLCWARVRGSWLSFFIAAFLAPCAALSV